MTSLRPNLAVPFAALLFCSLGSAPAQSGPAELALLTSYVGQWSGGGELVGGQAPESFRCRMTITKGRQDKINYAGRCALVNMNLSVAGTIAFDDASGRYLAAMSSNAGFTGYAVGHQRGNNVDFDLAESRTDRAGSTVRIGSRIHLRGSSSITVDFQVEFNNSGHVLTAVVPFTKQSA